MCNYRAALSILTPAHGLQVLAATKRRCYVAQITPV